MGETVCLSAFGTSYTFPQTKVLALTRKDEVEADKLRQRKRLLEKRMADLECREANFKCEYESVRPLNEKMNAMEMADQVEHNKRRSQELDKEIGPIERVIFQNRDELSPQQKSLFMANFDLYRLLFGRHIRQFSMDQDNQLVFVICEDVMPRRVIIGIIIRKDLLQTVNK